MTSSDDLQLPRDPGPVPASLRDAFAWARDTDRASTPGPLPDDDGLSSLAADDGDDDTRFALIEQLLASPDGARTLAHVVAARTSTAGTVEYFSDTPTTAAPIVPRAFVDGAFGARPRGALSALKPLLLAASLMLVAGTSWYVFTLPPAGDELRSLGSSVELLPVQPAVTRAPITLRWKPLRDDARYTVEVMDSTDTPVFTSETNATETVLAASALKPGTYRWFVRARATDRTEIRSRVETFTIK